MDAETKAKLVRQVMEIMERAHAPFPYLLVRIKPAVYGIAPLPAALDRESLIALAQREHATHGHVFSMCVVFALDDAVYLDAEGQPHEGPRPWGGRTVHWPLGAQAALAPASLSHH